MKKYPNISEEELTELARQKRNEYQRDWKRKNPEKVKQYKENYWKNQVLKDLEVTKRG